MAGSSLGSQFKHLDNSDDRIYDHQRGQASGRAGGFNPNPRSYAQHSLKVSGWLNNPRLTGFESWMAPQGSKN